MTTDNEATPADPHAAENTPVGCMWLNPHHYNGAAKPAARLVNVNNIVAVIPADATGCWVRLVGESDESQGLYAHTADDVTLAMRSVQEETRMLQAAALKPWYTHTAAIENPDPVQLMLAFKQELEEGWQPLGEPLARMNMTPGSVITGEKPQAYISYVLILVR